MSRHNKNLEDLKVQIGRTDSQAVDVLYGLEPVFEPSAAAPTAALGDFIELLCPYCGEVFGSHVDLIDRSRVYIEDCQVCCQPIEITLDVNAAGELLGATTERLD